MLSGLAFILALSLVLCFLLFDNVAAYEHQGDCNAKPAPNVKWSSCNMSNRDLQNVDLSGADLRWADLSGANLAGVNLQNADLTTTNLRGADLTNVNLAGAKLYNTNLDGAKIDGINISGVSGMPFVNMPNMDLRKLNFSSVSDMQVINLKNSNLSGKDLSGKSLPYANLDGANLSNANLEGSNLIGASLKGANLDGANLSGTRLQFASLQGINLYNTNLSGAFLAGTNLQKTNLEGADLTGIDFNGANLNEAQMRGVDLKNANLEHASLQNTHLELANLENTILLSSDLRGANLKNAKLNGANLYFVKINGTNFEGAKLENIIAPPDFLNEIKQGIKITHANKIEWKYDGAVSSHGCERINGTLVDVVSEVDSQPVQVCEYENKMLRIVNNEGFCLEMVTSWTDPETGKTYGFPDSCGHPVFCDSSGGSQYGRSPYAVGSYLANWPKNTENENLAEGISVTYDGNICYDITKINYFHDQKSIKIISEGQWKEAKVTVITHESLLSGEIDVTVNGVKTDHFVTSYHVDFPPGKKLSRLLFELEPSLSKYEIWIGPDVILGNKFSKSLDVMSPKKQLASGILPTEIKCKEGLELIFKSSSNMPACVKPHTAEKLVQRGWGVQISDVPKQNISKAVSISISPEKAVYKIGEPISITITNIGTETVHLPDASRGISVRNPDNVGTCCVTVPVETTLEPNHAFTYNWIITDWNNTPPKTGNYTIYAPLATPLVIQVNDE